MYASAYEDRDAGANYRAVTAAWLVLMLVALLSAAACGSKHQAAALSAKGLTQVVRVDFSSTETTPKEPVYEVGVGKIVYVQVHSDVAGVVSVPAYQVAKHVKAGGQTVLVFSANDPGTLDVHMRHGTFDGSIA